MGPELSWPKFPRAPGQICVYDAAKSPPNILLSPLGKEEGGREQEEVNMQEVQEDMYYPMTRLFGRKCGKDKGCVGKLSPKVQRSRAPTHSEFLSLTQNLEFFMI